MTGFVAAEGPTPTLPRTRGRELKRKLKSKQRQKNDCFWLPPPSTGEGWGGGRRKDQEMQMPGIAVMAAGSKPASVAKWRPRSA